jgi:hypothetical protein
MEDLNMLQLFFGFKYICENCSHNKKFSLSQVRQCEEIQVDENSPPLFKCEKCNNGLMFPLNYRLKNGEVFKYTLK